MELNKIKIIAKYFPKYLSKYNEVCNFLENEYDKLS